MQDRTSEPAGDVLDTFRAGGLVMRGALMRLIAYGAGGVVAAVSAILLTRHLGVARFGQYATIIALATLVTQLTEGGLTNLATRDFALTSPARKARLMADRLGLQIVTTFLAIALCLIFALAVGYGRTRTWSTAVAAVGLGLAAVQLTVAVPLVTSLRLGLTSALEFTRQLILVALTVALVIAGAGLFPFLLALVPSSLVVLAATWALSSREIALRPRFHLASWAALVRPAIVLSLSSGLASIYVFTAQILVSLAASAHETGLFAASLRVFAVIASVPGVMVTTALPLLARAARDDSERLEFAMDRLFAVALVGGIGIGVVLVVGAEPIIEVIAGPRYKGAVAPLRIEGAAVLGTCLTPVWSTGLLALHRHLALLMSNLVAIAMISALTLWLAPSIGARGAAIATVGGEWTVALCLLVALARARPDLVPHRAALLARVALAALVALAPLLIPIAPVARLALSMLLYGVAIVALRAFPRELLELLPARRARSGGA